MLIGAGLNASAVDPCLFFGADILVVVYVDDLFITSRDTTTIRKFQAAFSSKFKMKDVGVPSMVLGVNVSCQSGKVKLSIKDSITKIGKEHRSEKVARVECSMQKEYDPNDMTSPFV